MGVLGDLFFDVIIGQIKRVTMNKQIANWVKSSQYDLKTAEYMFETGRYIY